MGDEVDADDVDDEKMERVGEVRKEGKRVVSGTCASNESALWSPSFTDASLFNLDFLIGNPEHLANLVPSKR